MKTNKKNFIALGIILVVGLASYITIYGNSSDQKEQEAIVDKKINELNQELYDTNDSDETKEKMKVLTEDAERRGLLNKERFMTKENLLRDIESSISISPDRLYFIEIEDTFSDEKKESLRDKEYEYLHQLEELKKEINNYDGNEGEDMKYLYDKFEKLWRSY